MNVNDYEVTEVPVNMLEAIFNKQAALMPKYHDIEKRNGLLQTDKFPFDLHDRHCQARIKDFLWRASEELAESLEHQINEFADGSVTGDVHNIEEIIDALHFHTENCIQCDIKPQDILDQSFELDDLVDRLRNQYGMVDKWTLYNLAYTALGLTGNTLKNKPWKQDHRLTDIQAFNKRMIQSYRYMIALCVVGFNMQAVDIYNMYFKKNQVNQFRQRSGY